MVAAGRRKVLILLIILLIAVLVGAKWGLDLYKFGQHLYFGTYYGIVNRHEVKKSRIETVSFYSQSLQENKEYRIYLPDAYDNEKDRIPVLYLLHGYPGSDQDWLINTNLQKQLDDLIASGRLTPVAVVFPDGQGSRIRDSQFVDADLVDQRMESFVTQDLVSDVETKFRVRRDRLGRAIGGLSSGGYGAVNLALRHNEEYGYALSFSGYFDGSETALRKLLRPESIKSNTPLVYLSNLSLNPKTAVILLIGQRDQGRFVQSNRALASLLEQKNIPVNLIIDPNEGHGWSLWRKQVPVVMSSLNDSYLKMNGK